MTTSANRYQALFDSLHEGFCIIKFLDGPHGPLSADIHIGMVSDPAHGLEVLTKPFTVDGLIRRVDRMMREDRGREDRG